jgi:hypothetical protein
MSRRSTVTVLVGVLLGVGYGAPALADPIGSEDNREVLCLRLEGESGAREGVCVWVPLP